MGYKRNDKFFDRSDFRVNGDVIDIFPAETDFELESISNLVGNMFQHLHNLFFQKHAIPDE